MAMPTTAVRQEKNRSDFRPPGYKNWLSALMDLVRFGPGTLSNSQFLALLFHAERSVCWSKSRDAASLSQMDKGIRTKGAKGKWIRAGAGLKKSAAAVANQQLEALGLLKRRRQHSSRRGNEPTEYEPQWKNLKIHFRKSMSVEPLSIKAPRSPLVHETDKPLVHETDKACPFNGQTVIEVHQSINNNRDGEAVRKARREVGKPALPETAVLSSVEPDDENLPPEQRFMARVRARHGEEFDATGILATVKAELEKGSVPFEDYLQADLAKTTAPRKLTNPAGHYRKIAKDLVLTARASVLSQTMPAAPMETPHCQSCRAGRIASGGYCDCPLGKDLERVEARVNGRSNVVEIPRAPGEI